MNIGSLLTRPILPEPRQMQSGGQATRCAKDGSRLTPHGLETEQHLLI